MRRSRSRVGSRRRLGRRYWLLWTAVSVSSWGDGLELAALPLLGASLARDPRLVSGVTVAATLPWLVFGLVAGGLVDRHDRRRLMWRVNVMRSSLIALLAVLVALGRINLPVLYILVFLLGLSTTLFTTASQAILPDLVSRESLATANSRRQVSETVGITFVGAPAGGALFSAAAALPFALDAVTFAVSGALVAAIPGSYAAGQTPAGGEVERSSLRAEIVVGGRWLLRHPVLRPLAMALGLANLAVFMGEGIFVLFATRELGVTKAGYGLLLSAMAIGAVVGGLVGARLLSALGPARCVVAVLVALAVAHAVLGTLSSALAVGAVAACIAGATTVWNVATISMRQAVIPRELQGRVNSAYRVIGMGSLPLGAVFGGLVANAWGLRAPFFVAAALLLVATTLAATRIRQRDVTAAMASGGGYGEAVLEGVR
jgi:MFS family permease